MILMEMMLEVVIGVLVMEVDKVADMVVNMKVDKVANMLLKIHDEDYWCDGNWWYLCCMNMEVEKVADELADK